MASNGLNELRATKSGDEACAIMAKPSHKARPAVAGQLYSIVRWMIYFESFRLAMRFKLTPDSAAWTANWR